MTNNSERQYIRKNSNGGSQADQLENNSPNHRNPVLTEEQVRAAAQVFDGEIVFKLVLSRRGLITIRPTALLSCVNMTELDLSSNQIDRMQGFDQCFSLKKLILTSNRISRIEGLQGLDNLEVLMIQDNCIGTLDDLSLDLLGILPCLRSVYLQNIDGSQANSVAKDSNYRTTVISALPRLRILDGERNPECTGYCAASKLAMDAATETEMGVSIDDLPLPTPRNWFEGWSWDEPGNSVRTAMHGLSSQLKKIHLQVEQCKSIMKAVKDEQKTFRTKMAFTPHA